MKTSLNIRIETAPRGAVLITYGTNPWATTTISIERRELKREVARICAEAVAAEDRLDARAAAEDALLDASFMAGVTV